MDAGTATDALQALKVAKPTGMGTLRKRTMGAAAERNPRP
jgi:hypothetical protein